MRSFTAPLVVVLALGLTATSATAATTRGGHATPPGLPVVSYNAKLHSAIETRSGITSFGIPAKPAGCHATHSKITPAGRRLGVEAIVTYWCPSGTGV
jgi:hypothetical protein